MVFVVRVHGWTTISIVYRNRSESAIHISCTWARKIKLNCFL